MGGGEGACFIGRNLTIWQGVNFSGVNVRIEEALFVAIACAYRTQNPKIMTVLHALTSTI